MVYDATSTSVYCAHDSLPRKIGYLRSAASKSDLQTSELKKKKKSSAWPLIFQKEILKMRRIYAKAKKQFSVA